MGKTPDDSGFKFEWERKVAQCRLGAAPKSVAAWLSSHANTHGRGAHPGVRRLAYETELGESTVRRSLERLRELGLIVRVLRGSVAEKRNYADKYDLVIPNDLESKVEVRKEPAQQRGGHGRGGKANHVRWHEQRGQFDADCIHCAKAQESLAKTSGGFPEPFAKPSPPIRPPLGRISDQCSDGSDHRSVEEHQQAFTTKHVSHHSDRPRSGPRASSRARDLPLFAEFFEAQWNERVQPGEKLSKEDVSWLEHEIAYDYVIECIGGEDFYPGEEAAIFGRLANGDNPKAIVNMILSQREAA